MSLEQEVKNLVTASDGLTAQVSNKISKINQRMNDAENEFAKWKSMFSETVNGIEVFKQGRVKSFFFSEPLNSGGYTDSIGPDSDFPVCKNPQPPTYINLLEFVSPKNYGLNGDIFKIEFFMTHRGMGAHDSYVDYFIFTGASFMDSVAGQIEIKKVAQNSAVSIFSSMPKTGDFELAITRSMKGEVIPFSFRSINEGTAGVARVMLKVDTRYHCGNSRDFGANVMFTSKYGRPAENRVSIIKPQWDV